MLAITVFGLAFVTYRAWVADDAYITFRHVANCHLGYGPVFNPGERVQAYSHPLWFLILLAGSSVVNLYALAVACGLFFTVATTLAVAFFLRHSPGRVAGLLVWFVILFSSRTFVEFQTSGLETALSALLLTVLFGWMISRESRRQLIRPAGVAWLSALLVLNRSDYVILCTPMLVAFFYAWRSVCRAQGSIGKGQWFGILTAALAVVAWYGFATVYYGTPLPNTAYAKTNLPLLIALRTALWYAAVYIQEEPFHGVAMVAIMIGSLSSAVSRMKKAGPGGFLLLCVASAIVLHLAYVFAIGGDYMRGRFYLPVLIGSAVLAAQLIADLWPRLSVDGRLLAFVGLALMVGCALRARLLWMLMQLAERVTHGDPSKALIGAILLLVLIAGAGLLEIVLAWRTHRPRWALAGIQLVVAMVLGAAVVATHRATFTFSAGVILAGLTASVLLAAWPIQSARAGLVPAVLGTAFLAAAGSICDFTLRTAGQGTNGGIADEWALYHAAAFRNPFQEPPEGWWLFPGLPEACGKYAEKHGPITVMLRAIGIFSYHAGPDAHILDLHGLTDAFVARGYAKPTSRVGHPEFEVPRSYLEARGAINLCPDWVGRVMRDDKTLIEEARAAQVRAVWPNAEALERYKLVWEVVSGEIFAQSRWRKLPAFVRPRRPGPGQGRSDWHDF